MELDFNGFSEFHFSMNRALMAHATDDMDPMDGGSTIQGLLNIYIIAQIADEL